MMRVTIPHAHFLASFASANSNDALHVLIQPATRTHYTSSMTRRTTTRSTDVLKSRPPQSLPLQTFT